MNLMRKMIVGAAIIGFCGTAVPADAQIYVNIRPPRPKVVVTHRPPRPAGAIWIEDDWRVNSGRYEYYGGRWEAPPRRGMTWRPGHWKNTPRRGYVWVPGRWVARRYY